MSKPKPYVPKLPLIYTKGKFSDWRRHDDCGTIRDSADMPVIQIRECLTSEESAEFREAKQDPCAAFGEQVVAAVNSHAMLVQHRDALLKACERGFNALCRGGWTGGDGTLQGTVMKEMVYAIAEVKAAIAAAEGKVQP